MVLKALFWQLRDDAIAWSKGRNWLLRLPFLIWFGYCLIRHLNDPLYSSIIGPLNLGIHELGHLIFSPLGKFLGVLGGTLLELLAPFLGILNFYRQNDYFAISLCFGWLSTSLFDEARYIADARSMSLPLVSPFGQDTVIHDWNYLLGQSGLLGLDFFFSFLFRLSAIIAMLVCLSSGLWLLRKMRKQAKSF